MLRYAAHRWPDLFTGRACAADASSAGTQAAIVASGAPGNVDQPVDAASLISGAAISAA